MNKEQLELVYTLPYSNVFLSNLLLMGGHGVYGVGGALIFLEDGRFKLFVPEKALKELAEKRYKEVLKSSELSAYKKDAYKSINEFKKFSNQKIEEYNNDQFAIFLDKFIVLAGNVLDLYQKLEYFYYSKIEEELVDYIKDDNKILQDILSRTTPMNNWPEDKRVLANYIIETGKLKFELRKEMNQIFVNEGSILGKVFAKITSITSRPDALSMTIEEIKRFLNGNKQLNVGIRHKLSCLYYDPEKKNVIVKVGLEAKDLLRNVNFTFRGELSGTVACRGNVRGIVKVITLSLDQKITSSKIHEMNVGNILVSDTTGPELMLAIKKAAAIVTNEGGLMSHAAVVSREFNIPCVVGTKIATQVLKDGDLVEVDGERGVVRIIKNESRKTS